MKDKTTGEISKNVHFKENGAELQIKFEVYLLRNYGCLNKNELQNYSGFKFTKIPGLYLYLSIKTFYTLSHL